MNLKALNALQHLDITCLPAILHNRPAEIAPAVRRKIRTARARGYDHILCLYGDCGSGGALDTVLQEEGVERIEGAHCYAFYAEPDAFETLMSEEIGTYFLTDYLARHFDRLVWKGLGLDRFPELRSDYFRHYTRMVHLVQIPDAMVTAKAKAAAERLGLPLETRFTGLGSLLPFLTRAS
ncbi:DUF1638 domain-containing protein [Novosphingobium sp.]|uniref:DUF1638 domain-containing protein n=1 Tax=Novosphingobium sp. TaxID=1874826 RepID=UPI003BA9CC6E